MPSSPDQAPLHPLEFRILMVLTAEPSYGTAIVREIEGAEGPSATLYPANLFRRIRDLLARGLLEERPSPPGADPRRTYVGLTAAGRSAARAEARRLQAMVREAEARRLLPDGEG